MKHVFSFFLLFPFSLVAVAFAKIPPKTYSIAGHPVIADISTLQPSNPKISQSTVEQYVLAQTKALGVNPVVVSWIVSHESQWNPLKTGDDGESRGLWQISAIYHPEVSNACAYSMECSTSWALHRIIAGHVNDWSTWRFRFKLYPNQSPPV